MEAEEIKMIIKIGNKPYELATKEEVMEEVMEEVKEVIENFAKIMFDKIYPVGSIYLSMNPAFDPNVIFGGVWEKVKEGIFLEATEFAGNVGTETEAGLPNITGIFNKIAEAASGGQGASGAFYYNLGRWNIMGSGTSNLGGTMVFDASRSSAVYGKSTTVQPHSVKAFMWKRVS